MNEALLESAMGLHQAGQLAKAARLYREILNADPRHFRALYLLGFVHFQLGDFAQAEQMIGAAIAIDPEVPDAHYNRGCALQQLKRHADALLCFDRAVALQPRYEEALINRGVTLCALQRDAEALASLDRALAINPRDVEGWSSRGNALLALGRNGEALKSFEQALALAPDRAAIWNSLGAVLVAQKRHEEALSAFGRALRLDPDYEMAVVNRALALLALERREEALATYDAALAMRPDNAHFLNARADVYLLARRYREAAAGFAAALARDPDYPYARGNLALCKCFCCDWHGLAHDKAQLAASMREGKRAVKPFQSLALSDNPESQLQAARSFAAELYRPAAQPLWQGERYGHERIRLAYLSADFNDHAVATQMAGVFEHHDRTRFEPIAISFRAASGSQRETRLAAAFERFIPAVRQSDAEVAQDLRRMEIDIAVDLMGYTGECRPGIFAFRPAPIQVNYLGFPGTMGAPYMDYIVADRIVIPEDEKPHYSEAVVYLPDTYMPTDSTRPIAASTPTRSEAQLPESGFVFASFNHSYKFSPELFAIWMRLLTAVEGSVLWLPAFPAAEENLRREVQARGVAAARLVFAPFTAAAENHLARLKLADLFLDTLPYNAHATAGDALWAGLPVLSCKGTTFAGRVAASLLHAAGLPELVTESLAAYEALALKLAREPQALASLKTKLAANRSTHPLFDTARFTRNLEAAYVQMWECYTRNASS